MPVDSHTTNKPNDSTVTTAGHRGKTAGEKEGLRCRLVRLLGDTARALDLEGRSQLK